MAAIMNSEYGGLPRQRILDEQSHADDSNVEGRNGTERTERTHPGHVEWGGGGPPSRHSPDGLPPC
jgi:hypothetical protein